MEIVSVSALRGPNIWSRQTVLQATLSVAGCAPRLFGEALDERVRAALPAIEALPARALDGSRLLSAGEDRVMCLWDLGSGNCVARLGGHEGPVSACTFLRGGQVLSASVDGSVRLWSLETAAEIGRFERPGDDILSLARVGRPRDPREPSELSALVASVVEEYEDMGEPVALGDTTRLVLPLRATWLRRALRNLIGNALRYGSNAHVSLLREGDSAVIRIEDNGPGIAEADIERMQEPFARGEPSRNSETGGAGLGLALARAIAEQHGGALRLSNRKDAAGRIEGLRAEIRLPLT